MFKIFSHIKVLDEKIFSLISELKNNEWYQNFNQKILSLDENYQKIIQFFAFAFILFLPVLTLLGVLLASFTISSNIEQKKQILDLIELQLSLNKQVQSFNNTLISSLPVNSEDDLKTSFTNNALLAGINNKITYFNFNQSPLVANYKDSEVTLKFNQISTPDLANIINLLYEQYKARIVEVSINRNAQNKLIQGEISVNIISN